MAGAGARAELAADWVARFADFWSSPSPERLDLLLGDPVLLVAPMTPTTHTLEEGRRAFAEIFDLIPDLTGEVHRWGATEDGVLVEFTLGGNAGGAPISWPAVDRVVIRNDGLASERISYFDSAPIVLTAARRPRSWPALAGTRLRRLRR